MTALDFRPPTSTADDLRRDMRRGRGWPGLLRRRLQESTGEDVAALTDDKDVKAVFGQFEDARIAGAAEDDAVWQAGRTLMVLAEFERMRQKERAARKDKGKRPRAMLD